jgi:hypothetical protein
MTTTAMKREIKQMLAVFRKAIPWVGAALVTGVAVAQQLQPNVGDAVSDSWTTVPAADGSHITTILDGDKRLISAYGVPRGGTFLEVDISYQPAGITYTFNGPVPGILTITVLNGTRAVYVEASTANEKVYTLILQWPCVQVPELGLDLATYTVDSVPDRSLNKNEQPTAGLPGPTQAYLHAGAAINNDFQAYAPAAQYFAPVLTPVANHAPPPNAVAPPTSIVAKLQSDQSVPPPQVCPTSDAGNSFGLLACIGVGIGNGAPSPIPDQVLKSDGLTCNPGGGPSGTVLPCDQGSAASDTSSGACAKAPQKN